MQHAGRWTEAGQEMNHTAYWQMDRSRAGDGSYSMPADGQRQGRGWIAQHACRWIGGAGQQMEHTACRQMDRGTEIVLKLRAHGCKDIKYLKICIFRIIAWIKHSKIWIFRIIAWIKL
jgi:hypothetical protein